MIGYCFCGSFCTFSASIKLLRGLCGEGNAVQPFMSENAYSTDTRFGKAEDIIEEIEGICQRKIVHTIAGAERYGPELALEMLVMAPCTGNTLAKLASGITDTAATMAAKAHLRQGRPLVIALATNDALSANLRNIGLLMARKNVFFVPLYQDDPTNKPQSLVCDFGLVKAAMLKAMEGKQIQPVFLCGEAGMNKNAP